MVRNDLGCVNASQIVTDSDTRRAEGAGFISDVSFFRLFSNATYHCLDVSDYEGAEIMMIFVRTFPKIYMSNLMSLSMGAA